MWRNAVYFCLLLFPVSTNYRYLYLSKPFQLASVCLMPCMLLLIINGQSTNKKNKETSISVTSKAGKQYFHKKLPYQCHSIANIFSPCRGFPATTISRPFVSENVGAKMTVLSLPQSVFIPGAF